MSLPQLTLSCLLIFIFQTGLGQTSINSNTETDLEAIQHGERLYREGLLSTGVPVQAFVAEDIAVDGRMFTCINCHQRSGLGSVEGSIVTWPINGPELFASRRRTGAWSPSASSHQRQTTERWSLPAQFQAADARPAYTVQSLAKAIRSGISADGRTLNSVMPRYKIDDREMNFLVHYLTNLSDSVDPGVDNDYIRFATVVTGSVPAADRNAMLDVLQAHFDIHNTQTRPHLRRAEQSPFYKSEQYVHYRKIKLDIWELTGPPETWRLQLEHYYQNQPVFALLGGIANGGWAPIHNFCEDNGLPNIFPITDQPVISDTDWYTLYFTKGLYQEGETAARFIRDSVKSESGESIVQVYRAETKGELAAHGFISVWSEYQDFKLSKIIIEPGGLVSDSLKNKLEGLGADIIVLWLEKEDVASVLNSNADDLGEMEMILGSASLFAEYVELIPDEIKNKIFFTNPQSIPDENKNRLTALKQWLKIRGIKQSNLSIQSKMYFLGWLLPDAIAHMRGNYYRDYFLEGFEMMTDQDSAITVYPRLSFGPGQRYASKGCYISQVSTDNRSGIANISDWIVN